MRITLADGRTQAGQIARWDDEGFEGTIGRFRWDDLKPMEVSRVRSLLIDALPPTARMAASLELAAYLWSVDGGDAYAERAAKSARGLGADDAAIAAAKALGATIRGERAARDAAVAAAKLRTASPEGDRFPPAPWQPVNVDQLEGQVQGLRQRVVEKLALAGREIPGVEGDTCIVWSDLGIEDAARRAVDIDAFVVSALKQLGLGGDVPASALRPAKMAVLVMESADRFRLLEAAAFQQAVGSADAGIAHYEGPDVIVVVQKQADEVNTLIECCRGAARSILHRLVSPIRLPPWAHEGLVDTLVMGWKRTAAIDKPLRRDGLAFIRAGGSLEQVLAMTYDEGSWPGPDRTGRPAGYLLVNLMMEAAPGRFLRFVGAVKSGKPWQQALQEDFGSTPAQLLQTVRGHYRFND